jgi:hypothetical protein
VAHELLVRRTVEEELKVLTPHFLEQNSWELNSTEFPYLDVTILGPRPLRVRMNCEDWPDRSPSAELLEVSGETLNVGGFAIFNMSPHPSTGKPFVCMRGFDEYHTHPSHLTELWENYRRETGNNLIGLLTQVSRSWRKAYPR